MKRRLNILCILVILVLSFSVFTTLYYSGMGFGIGMKAGMRHDEAELEKITNMHIVSLFPDNLTLLTDSVYNAKSESFIPATYSQLLVSVKAETTSWGTFLATMLPVIGSISLLIAIVYFIKFVVAVNKSDIFFWKNVRRLRWIGFLLVFNFISILIPALMTYSRLTGVLTIKGYTLTVTDHLSITNLIVGIVALIIAEVFAIGLRMKEDQDLTI